MPDLVPANGQFGDDYFTVYSKNASVPGKYLKDSLGENYIIDPATSKPYVVPFDYDPGKTAAYFSDSLKEALFNPVADVMAPGASIAGVYRRLYDAFQHGGWGDLQRPLPDKTQIFDAFRPAANFNYGVGAAAAGLPVEESIFAGGAYNLLSNYRNAFSYLMNNPGEFGNAPGNVAHIMNGADHFNQGTFGASQELAP